MLTSVLGALVNQLKQVSFSVEQAPRLLPRLMLGGL